MRITRNPLARLVGGGFALATATALVLPGVAAADDNKADTGSSALSAESGSSSGSLEKLPIPAVQDFVKAMQKIASGEIDLASIDKCVRAEFGKEDLEADPISVIISCVNSAGGETSDDSKDKKDDVKKDKTDEQRSAK